MQLGVACITFCFLLSFAGEAKAKKKDLNIVILRDVHKSRNAKPHLPPSHAERLGLNAWEYNYAVKGFVNEFLLNHTNYRLANLREVSVNSARDVTYRSYESSFDAHVVFIRGGIDTVSRASTVLSMSNTPVISLEPIHHWESESRRLPHVLTPWFGQHLKGRATSQILTLDSVKRVKWCTVIREETISVELREFKKAQNGFLDVEDYIVSQLDYHSNFKSLGDAVAHLPNGSYFEYVVIDCHLYFLDRLLVVVSRFIHRTTTVFVFLHDYLDVVHWIADSPAAHLLPDFTLLLYQKVIYNEGNSTDLPSSIYEALEWDLFISVASGAASSNFNGYRKFSSVNFAQSGCFGVDSVLFVSLLEGPQLLNALESNCASGFSGKVLFTNATELPANCFNDSLVSFEIRRLHVDWVDNRTTTRWSTYGNWTNAKGALLKAPFPDLYEAIQVNYTLTVLVYPSPPFTMWNNETNSWEGVEVDILKMIEFEEGSVLNFEFISWNRSQILPAADEREFWAKLAKTYDLLIGGFPLSHNRNNAKSYFTTGVTILTLNTSVQNDDSLTWWGFLDPFRWTVWLVTGLLLLISTLMSKWLGLVNDYGDGLWLSSASVFFMNENRLVQMRNPFGRIYIVSLCFVFLVLVSAYTANMISFLTLTTEKPLATLSALKESKSLVATSYSLVDELRDSAGLKRLRPVDDEAVALELLRNNTVSAYIAEKTSLDRLILKSRPCDLLLSSDLLFKKQIAPFFGSKSADERLSTLNGALERTTGNGIGYTLYDKYVGLGLTKSGCEIAYSSAESARAEESLELQNLAGIFIVAAAAAALFIIMRLLLVWLRRRPSISITPAAS